jgi:hypothetical protein
MSADKALSLARKIVSEANAAPKHPVYHGSSWDAQLELSRALLKRAVVIQAARDVSHALSFHGHPDEVEPALAQLKTALDILDKEQP